VTIRENLRERWLFENVTCGPPGIGAKKIQEISQDGFEATEYTYIAGGAVALEGAGVDLDICIISINSSALQVACPPPGIGEVKSGTFRETTTPPLTYKAVLASKVESWMATIPSTM
jgi:hypothetical protein